METGTDKDKFKTVFTRLVELMEDEEFGSDMDGPDYDEQRQMVHSVLLEFGFEDVEPALYDRICGHVISGADDYFQSEYASIARGGRSGHRNSYLRDKTLLKNQVRTLFGMTPKGVKETEEIDQFLREQGDRVKDQEYAEYSEVGTLIAGELVARFGLGKDLSRTLVGVCGDRYGWGKTHRVRNDQSGWNRDHLEYAGVKLARLRSKK